MRKIPWAMVAALFFFIMVGYVPAGVFAAAENPSVPIAVFPEKAFEFGAVLEGKEIAHDFVVQNRGASELIIENVKPG
jgi:hypothetical protein